MTQLTTQFHIPDDHHEACNRLTTLVQQHVHRLLHEEYWTDQHFQAIQQHTGQSYTYIRDDDNDCFENVNEYLYSRFKRCIYHRAERGAENAVSARRSNTTSQTNWYGWPSDTTAKRSSSSRLANSKTAT